ncbi:MAG: YitT family protein [Bacteroidales bacterium]|nr:YitT family protein [Bacteroidales bacterium]
MPRKFFTVFWDYVIMSLGCVIFCLAWDGFMIPNGIASGGVMGLCTIFQFATGVPVPYTYILLNAILLGIGFWVLGTGFGFKTIYCIALTTVLFQFAPDIDIIKSIPGNPLYISDKILIPVIGGLLEAIGILMIFRRGGSTGGTDIVALIFNKYWPISPGKVFMIVDFFIIASILLVPGKTLQDMVYGYIAMIAFSLFLDFLMLGEKATAQVLVFSKKYEEIADEISLKLNRGVTALKAVGWYSKADSKVLLIIVKRTQLQPLTKAIKNIDPKAFVSVSSASGVYGEGFEEMKTGIDKNSLKK